MIIKYKKFIFILIISSIIHNNILSMEYNNKIVILCYHRFNLKSNTSYSIKKEIFEQHIKTAID